MGISTQVMDAVAGQPIADLAVTLRHRAGGTWRPLAEARTNSAGEIRWKETDLAGSGRYCLLFHTGVYYADAGVESVFPLVAVCVHHDGGPHDLHLPLLMTPVSFTVYRGGTDLGWRKEQP